MIKFLQYGGDLIGLPTSGAHLNYRWVNPDCKIVFSMCRQGNAASCHFASDRAGMFRIRTAIREFCEFVFKEFPWCEMVLAKIKDDRVGRLVENCGFEKISTGVCGTASAWIKER